MKEKRRKLNYRFHDPNPVGVTANYLLQILIEANSQKVEWAIQQAASQLAEQPKQEKVESSA